MRDQGNGLIVDLFAGGGGASTGIEAAMGRPVDIAINHDAIAIAVHSINHPSTLHLRTNVWEVDPIAATKGAPVDLLWASPDCRHFSRAKGGVPRDQGIRSLAWVVVDWAKKTLPRVIALENVLEWRTWGPLDERGHPCKARAGQTYDEWTHALRRLGYEVEDRVLDASLYGAPTKRRRLFVVARRDGQPIVWPEPTHGPGRLPVRTAAECIDWSIPCPSIFDRKRPLAPATLRRVAEGIRRFVLGTVDPFIVLANHGGDEFRAQSIDEPMRTVTAAHDARGLVAPLLSKAHSHGWDRNGGPSAPPSGPLNTIVAKDATCLVAPLLSKYNGTGADARNHDLRDPIRTLDTSNRFGLVSAFLAHHYGGEVGRPATVPLGTVTAKDHHSVVAAHLAKFYGTAVGHDCRDPLHTATAKARFALVTTFLEAHGIPSPHIVAGEYGIADIGLRMLDPHELLRAQFGDHAETYDLSAAKSKAAKIRLIGNSVCPDVAAALIRANCAQGVPTP